MQGRPGAEEFAELSLTLHEVSSFDEKVERVLEFAVKALNCEYAGIILVHERSRVETLAATHPVVADLDKIQLEVGEGPDLEILGDRHGVMIRDIRTEERWPAWLREADGRGIRSMLGTRMYTTKTAIGSINFYDSKPNWFDEVDVDVAHMLGRHAAVALETARSDENLWKAIDARNLIGQAQGILMERFGIDAEQAFAVLRRYSQANNTKLNVVAERLIDSGRLPE
jgi:GAF domain-containing protein